MSKNPRHRAGDPPVEVVQQAEPAAPAAAFDLLVAPAPEAATPAAAPVEAPAAGAPTDNVAIMAGLFGEAAPASPAVVPELSREEPAGSLGDLVQPMQTWPPAAAPVAEPAQTWSLAEVPEPVAPVAPPVSAAPPTAAQPWQQVPTESPAQLWPAAPVQDPAQVWPEAAPTQVWPAAAQPIPAQPAVAPEAPVEQPQTRGRRAASYTDENAFRG